MEEKTDERFSGKDFKSGQGGQGNAERDPIAEGIPSVGLQMDDAEGRTVPDNRRPTDAGFNFIRSSGSQDETVWEGGNRIRSGDDTGAGETMYQDTQANVKPNPENAEISARRENDGEDHQARSFKTCGQRTEVYSRVVGYFRPVQQWNPGKQAEFKERTEFKINGGIGNESSKKSHEEKNCQEQDGKEKP
jgi:hypothetical protein